MSAVDQLRSLSIPLLFVLLVGLPVFWAFPEGLPFWRATAIVAGWAGAALLLASLLLMVRERGLASGLGGLARITRWHHRAGLTAYVALLAHPLALAADGWQESPIFAWQSISPFAENWPVWLGWAGLLLLMAGLAATFATRLPYGTWRWLHGLLGVAVLLGFIHVLLLGIDLAAILALGAAVLLLVWRLLRIDAGLAARPYIVDQVEALVPGMVEISLLPLSRPLDIQPGQFILAAFFQGPRYRGCGEYHPFTVSGTGPDHGLRIGVKALGDCTACMQSLEPGVPARVHGPFGEFLREGSAAPMFWLAGGIGITPFIGYLRSSPLRQPTRLLYLYRSDREAAYLGQLQSLAEHRPELNLQPVATGSALPDLERLLPDAAWLAGRECHVCGPPALLDAVTPILVARGVPREHIHSERFDFR